MESRCEHDCHEKLQCKSCEREKQSHAVCQFPREEKRKEALVLHLFLKTRQVCSSCSKKEEETSQLNSLPANDLGERGKEKETIHCLDLKVQS